MKSSVYIYKITLKDILSTVLLFILFFANSVSYAGSDYKTVHAVLIEEGDSLPLVIEVMDRCLVAGKVSVNKNGIFTFHGADQCGLSRSDVLHFTGNKITKSKKNMESISQALDEYAKYLKMKASVEDSELKANSDEMAKISRLKQEIHKSPSAWRLPAGTPSN